MGYTERLPAVDQVTNDSNYGNGSVSLLSEFNDAFGTSSSDPADSILSSVEKQDPSIHQQDSTNDWELNGVSHAEMLSRSGLSGNTMLPMQPHVEYSTCEEIPNTPPPTRTLNDDKSVLEWRPSTTSQLTFQDTDEVGSDPQSSPLSSGSHGKPKAKNGVAVSRPCSTVPGLASIYAAMYDATGDDNYKEVSKLAEATTEEEMYWMFPGPDPVQPPSTFSQDGSNIYSSASEDDQPAVYDAVFSDTEDHLKATKKSAWKVKPSSSVGDVTCGEPIEWLDGDGAEATVQYTDRHDLKRLSCKKKKLKKAKHVSDTLGQWVAEEKETSLWDDESELANDSTSTVTAATAEGSMDSYSLFDAGSVGTHQSEYSKKDVYYKLRESMRRKGGKYSSSRPRSNFDSNGSVRSLVAQDGAEDPYRMFRLSSANSAPGQPIKRAESRRVRASVQPRVAVRASLAANSLSEADICPSSQKKRWCSQRFAKDHDTVESFDDWLDEGGEEYATPGYPFQVHDISQDDSPSAAVTHQDHQIPEDDEDRYQIMAHSEKGLRMLTDLSRNNSQRTSQQQQQQQQIGKSGGGGSMHNSGTAANSTTTAADNILSCILKVGKKRNKGTPDTVSAAQTEPDYSHVYRKSRNAPQAPAVRTPTAGANPYDTFMPKALDAAFSKVQ